jgi:hypothetical protein
MNKRTILIGSLCIVLLLIGALYVMKTNEGFVDPPPGAALVERAKQAIAEATVAKDKALAAVNTPNEVSTAKDAFDKANAAVAAANAAVADTKAAFGTLNIETLQGFATQAQTQLKDAQGKETAAKGAKDDAQRAYDAAKQDEETKRIAYNSLQYP